MKTLPPAHAGGHRSAHWILGFPGDSLPRELAQAISGGRVDGLMLFRDNTGGSVAGAWALRREILSLVPPGRPFFLAADEEGGLISQTSGLALPDGGAWPSVPTPRALGRIGRPAACRFVGRLLGRRLRGLGVTVDFAPSLDLDTEGENPVIGSRSFGADPHPVSALGLAFAEGLASAGVTPCFKHYPGHGGTRLDSHRTLPTMDPAERRRHEAPFRECLRAIHAGSEPGARFPRPWVMGAHVDWGDGVPASLSRALLARIRRWLPGTPLVTDSLEMGAVSLAGGAARQALAAGNDWLLVARGWEAALAEMEGFGGQAAAGLPSVSFGAPASATTAASPAARRRLETGRSKRGLEDLPPRTDRRPTLVLPRADEAYLDRLHLASVRLSLAPAELPTGPWTWVVPEGLSPYVRLRSFRPSGGGPALGRTPSRAPGRSRFCAEVIWVPEGASMAFLTAVSRRVGERRRPALVATLFRGRPGKEVREAWKSVFAHPQVRLVAHLLDERWPGVGDLGEIPVALTSGPSAESLGALAQALEMPEAAWRCGDDGLHFIVDTGRTRLAK